MVFQKVTSNIVFCNDTSKKIFNLAHSITKDTRLINLQLKILHRVYACDSYVSNFDKGVNALCDAYCKKNDIIHWFFECNKVKPILNLFENWIIHNLSPDFRLSLETIIFGI